MRLIIKDYLLELKEKNELDLLLCDLLFQMGYITDNTPETGNRQYGVDIRAHNETELLLFVVKQGKLTRTIWDGNPNAVRPSLNEIIDCYTAMINGQDREKSIRIIVATNGMMDEAVRLNWERFTSRYTNLDGIPVQIEFWNIDTITRYVEQYLFDEHICDSSVQSMLRRALYFLDDADYKQEYYELVIQNLMSNLNEDEKPKARAKKLTGLNLTAQMIAHYSAEKGRYKIAINVTEYLVICYWKYLLNSQNLQKEEHVKWLWKFLASYEKWNAKYYESVKCCAIDGFPLYHPVVQRVMAYEVLGFLLSYAYYLSNKTPMVKSVSEQLHAVMDTIIGIINNTPQWLYAPYDRHIGVMSMLYRLLDRMGRFEESKAILETQAAITIRHYRILRQYPTPVDTLEDAVNIDKGYPAAEYNTSAFWGYMMEWIVLMEKERIYEVIQPFLAEDLKNVTKCAWFMRAEEESIFYEAYAMNRSGDGVVFEPAKSFSELCDDVLFVMKQFEQEVFSYEEYGFPALEFIVSRYYGYLPRVKREPQLS